MSNVARPNRLLPLALCAGLLVCCGYRLVPHGGAPLPESFGTVAVLPFENRTPDQGLGMTCARALQLELGAGPDLTDAPEDADIVMNGSVSSIAERPVGFALGEDRQVEMEASVRGEFVVTRRGVEIYRSPFEGTTTYGGAGGATSVDAQRSNALALACQRAMRHSALTMAEVLGDDSPQGPDGDRKTAGE